MSGPIFAKKILFFDIKLIFFANFRDRGVGGMGGAQKIRRTAVGAQACQGYVLNVLVENTCSKYLREARASRRPKVPRPCWNHVGTTFRSFFALGHDWAPLVRFLAACLRS